jgi:hypothetical protein
MINKKAFLVILIVLFSTVLACSTLTGLPEPTAQLPVDTTTEPIAETIIPIMGFETASSQTEKPEIPSPENSVPDPESIDIFLDSSNSVPDDILEQIGMYFGFGGGGDECFPFELNQADAIEWAEYTFYNDEGVPVTDQRLVWRWNISRSSVKLARGWATLKERSKSCGRRSISCRKIHLNEIYLRPV